MSSEVYTSHHLMSSHRLMGFALNPNAKVFNPGTRIDGDRRLVKTTSKDLKEGTPANLTGTYVLSLKRKKKSHGGTRSLKSVGQPVTKDKRFEICTSGRISEKFHILRARYLRVLSSGAASVPAANLLVEPKASVDTIRIGSVPNKMTSLCLADEEAEEIVPESYGRSENDDEVEHQVTLSRAGHLPNNARQRRSTKMKKTGSIDGLRANLRLANREPENDRIKRSHRASSKKRK